MFSLVLSACQGTTITGDGNGSSFFNYDEKYDFEASDFYVNYLDFSSYIRTFFKYFVHPFLFQYTFLRKKATQSFITG